MKKGLLTLAVTGAVFVTCVLYMIQIRNRITWIDLLMVGSILGILILSAITGIRHLKDHKTSQPPEDEMTLSFKHKAGHQSYKYSFFLWVFLYFIHREFEDPVVVLGSGIIGMAVIYLVCLFLMKPKSKLGGE